ncbi:MAG: protein archease [Actinobacteria bacterium]|nr:protein archease [Actinomycetota bacterium]
MSDMQNGFRILDHTADVGLQAHGSDLAQLFSNAARGMFSVISSLDAIQPTEHISVSVTADGLEDLLVGWLSELLYLFSARQMLFCRFDIAEIDDRHLRAAAVGEPIDLSRHELSTEIKAVTYHDLKVERINDIWQARVLFDV